MKTPILAMLLALGAARAWASPAADPTPPTVLHAGDFHPYWSAAVRLGAGLPLGSLANYNNAGFSGQLDGFCQVAPNTAIDLFALYAGMPSSGLPSGDAHTSFEGSPGDATVLGLGAKGLWQFYDMDQTRFFLDAGVGFASVARPQESVESVGGAIDHSTWTASAGPAVGGLLLSAGLGFSYELAAHLKLLAEVDGNVVDLSGGTSDLPQFVQPTVGLLYDFQ